MAAEPIPIRRVRHDGGVDMLGEWRPSTKELALDLPGFPLTPPGIHQVEGDLPWVFDEMAPSGYMSRNFAAWLPDLHLPRERALWSAEQVLRVIISRNGADLSGNLVIGEESWQAYRATVPSGPPSFDYAAALRNDYPRLVDDVLDTPSGSSVGGDRPKLVIEMPDGAGVIVKFTPELSTLLGRRWADLLRTEALVSATLHAAGVNAVQSQYMERGARGFLEIRRFDRVARKRRVGQTTVSSAGRVGHVTLFALGCSLYEEATDPEPVVSALVRDGHLSREDLARFRRIHNFSKAIANTDTHLGNYGLLIDDDGKARLSPAYDVLPMAFAPKHDELPDRLVKHTGPRDAQTDELVQRLIAAVEGDREISAEFRESWLRVVR